MIRLSGLSVSMAKFEARFGKKLGVLLDATQPSGFNQEVIDFAIRCGLVVRVNNVWADRLSEGRPYTRLITVNGKKVSASLESDEDDDEFGSFGDEEEDLEWI